MEYQLEGDHGHGVSAGKLHLKKKLEIQILNQEFKLLLINSCWIKNVGWFLIWGAN